MIIENIELIHLKCRYRTPFVYGGGTCTGRLTTLVKVHATGGHYGLGSIYSHPALVEIIVKQQLEPVLLGLDLSDLDSIWRLMYGVTRWYGRMGAAVSALGGIDVALWDLKSKLAGKPLRHLLSPQARDDCAVYASGLLWQDIASLQQEASKHLEDGFRRMKMRIARSDDYDAAAIRAVRKTIGPANDIMVDAVMRYDLATAQRLMPVFAENKVFWLEEPFSPEDKASFAKLKSLADVPIACGENEFGTHGFAPWIDGRLVDIVQPDVSRCGGITPALKVAGSARNAGLSVAPHTWNDAVAIIANAQLVAAIPNGITVEMDRTENPFITDLLQTPIRVRDGKLQLSDQPGLGIELRSDIIEQYRLKNPFDIPDGNYSDFAFGKGHFKPAAIAEASHA